MVRNCYDICKDVLGQHYDFDGGGGGPGGLYQCYDLANYVASFFGTRLVGPVAATIVYDNPQLYKLALVKTYDGQLETGDMIIFGPVGYNPAGHVAFYGHGDQTSATCIDQNHPAWSGVTEHTFNLLPLNPTHIVRFYNQEASRKAPPISSSLSTANPIISN